MSIAKLLNAEGILCPSEYKMLNGLNYKNCNRLESTSYWTYSTINVMLKNEMYRGNMVQGKKHQRMGSRQKRVDKENWIVVKGTHEPIIDLETWEKTQKLLLKRHRDMGLEENKNIFAGFIICADCGRAMMKNTWKRADGSRTYTFYCGTYKRHGKGYCTPHTLPLHVLEKIVLNDLRAIIQNVNDLKKLVENQSFPYPKAEEIARKELVRVKAELERVQKLKKSVYEDYKEGMISKEEFFTYREDYLKKEELYKKQTETLEERMKESVTEDVFQTPWLKRLLEMRDIEKLDRDMIVEMIDQIVVYENRKIKIRYNFGNELEHLFSNVYQESKVV